MGGKRYTILEERGLLALAGDETRGFLQSLISNDIDKAGPGRAIYATLLTPQGKFLHDFFIAEFGAGVVLDCEGARRDDLAKRLTLYKLRAQVTISPIDDHLVAALFGADSLDALGLAAEAGAARAFAGGVAFTDPRLAAAGARAMLPREGAREALEKAGFAAADATAYDAHRLALGLPDGSRDIPVDKGFLLEWGIDALNGVDFEKGCYVGQELTARTKYRASIRKRLYRVAVDGPLPAAGSPVTLDGKKIGEMRSGLGTDALALLRIEAVAGALEAGTTLSAENARLTPITPEWAVE